MSTIDSVPSWKVRTRPSRIRGPLLVSPGAAFGSTFAEIKTSNTVVHYTAFGTAALATVLFIAPSVHQRMRAPLSGIQWRTMSHVMFATRLAIAGTVCFLISVSAVVRSQSDGRHEKVYPHHAPFVATTLAGAFFVWLEIQTGSIWAPVAVHATVNMTMAIFGSGPSDRLIAYLRYRAPGLD